MPREPKDGYSLATMRLINRELSKIRARSGSITADNVLEAARDGRHPLHRFFDWDDASAAEKYRRQQAAQMIARVTVTMDVKGKPTTVRAYLGVDRDASRQYVPTVEVLNDADLKSKVMAEMKADLEAMRRRYESYEFCSKAISLLRRALLALEGAKVRRA